LQWSTKNRAVEEDEKNITAKYPLNSEMKLIVEEVGVGWNLDAKQPSIV
jgi:hypothetical protein